jgi:hypothetical protein
MGHPLWVEVGVSRGGIWFQGGVRPTPPVLSLSFAAAPAHRMRVKVALAEEARSGGPEEHSWPLDRHITEPHQCLFYDRAI